MNLDYAKPFANTSDLKNMTPKIFSDLARQKLEQERAEKRAKAEAAAFAATQEPVDGVKDNVTRLLMNAREAEGKRASRHDEKDQQEQQEFNLFYQREHTVAYLQRKMPYHYLVYKRLILEVQKRVAGFEPKSQSELQELDP